MLETRCIGESELRASVLGLGCNSLGWLADAPTSLAIVRAALDVGITFFDTADVYGRHGGSELLLGEALGPRRKEVLVATKFGAPMRRGDRPAQASRRYVETAVEASLKRLGTDWIDLYQLHWHDPETPIAETLDILDRMKRDGKIRAAGCCNLTATQFVEAQRCARELALAPFVSLQAPYSLLEREVEDEILPTLEADGASLIPYFPLAGGLLSDKYQTPPPGQPRGRLDRFSPHRDRFLNETMLTAIAAHREAARSRGESLLVYGLRWLSSRSGVATIIAGASRPEQVVENAAALST